MKEFFMTFDNDSDLYIQIYNQIKNDISNGKIKKDEKMPSRRKMADFLGVSVNTINNAYDILVEEGYLYTLPKKGYFASSFSIPLNTKKKTMITNSTTTYKYDFTTNNPDYSLFPRNTFNKISKEIIYNTDSYMMRGPKNGLLELRKAIKDILYEEKGIDVEVEQIIIKDSTATIIKEIRDLLNNPTTAIENPGYFMKNNTSFIPIDVDDKGIVVEKIEKTNAKLIIATPFSEFPLGVKMSLDRKNELALYLKKNNAYLIEDSLDSSFRNQAYKTTPLFNMSDKVIFTESFSRSIFPGLCISYMVLPLDLLEKYNKKYNKGSSNVSSLNQLILKEFITSGAYTSHINKLRLSFIKKKHLILDILDKDIFEIISTEAYSSIIVKVNDKYCSNLKDRLKENNINIPFLADYALNYNDSYLIIGFQSIPFEKINSHTNYLQDIIKNATN